jgi:Leucine-rich repeat (LRR) protein
MGFANCTFDQQPFDLSKVRNVETLEFINCKLEPLYFDGDISSSLRILDFSGSLVSPDQIDEILNGTTPAIVTLDRTAIPLAELQSLPRIQIGMLSLKDRRLSSADLAALSSAQLSMLDLRRSETGSSLAELKSDSIYQMDFSSILAPEEAVITCLQNCPNIKFLCLTDCAIGDSTLDAVERLSNLRIVNVVGTDVTVERLERFSNANPDIELSEIR